MSNKFLQRAFLLSVLLLFSGSIRADVIWDHGDIVGRDTSNTPLGWVIDEDLDILNVGSSADATITVSKDVYIIAHHVDVNVTVTSNNVYIQSAEFKDSYGHIIFYAAEGRTINVDCDFDITFKAKTASDPIFTNDMIVTFSGQGQTIFNLSDYNSSKTNSGAIVYFFGDSTDGYAYPGGIVSNIEHTNCRVNILMDHSETQALTNGLNKVLFRRKTGETHPEFRVCVDVWLGTMITFLSTNATGNVGDAGASGDFGAMAFDSTHTGTGRGQMCLYLKGRVNPKNLFADAGLVITGHYVPSWSEEDIRENVALNSIAGRRAIFRIVDDNRYSVTTNPTDADARGLLVINSNRTVPKLAIDRYQGSELFGLTHSDVNHPNFPDYWAKEYSWRNAPKTISTTGCKYYTTSNLGMNVQTGFILGKNGSIEIAHKTYMDYITTNTSKTDEMASEDYSTLRNGDISAEFQSSPIFKKKNPGAFFVDGLKEAWRVNTVDDQKSYNPTVDTNAQISLYGDAKILFRSSQGVSPMRWVENGEYKYTVTIDSATYNGQYIPSSEYESDEGVHVLDIEAPLTVRCFSENEMPGTGYTSSHYTYSGKINLPTVSIDYTGREYDYPTTSYITRPLTKDDTYQVCNSSSIFLNDSFKLYNTKFVHGDITKPLETSPSDAFPNFVGGESQFFNNTMYSTGAVDPLVEELYQLPRVELYNSAFDMHEHFVAAGCRFVVNEQTLDKDDAAVYGSDANNSSMFKFYDHGDQLDTLDHAFGRLFMASCANNKMSDGTTNASNENCTIDVYRKNQVNSPLIPADTIKLSLQSAYDANNPIMTHLVDPTDAQRAHHLILLNRPENGVGLIDIGWTTTFGDKTKYPWEAISGLGSNYFDINVTTSGDPNVGITNTPPATISIDGNYFYFGGTDWAGNKSTIPVTTTDQGSVIYVDHGGRITVTQPTGLDSIHGYDVFMDLPIAYRLWSYDGLRGIIDLPKDQTMYGYGFGRQAYNLNTVLVDEGSPIGVHLDTYNSVKVDGYSGRTSADRYSGEEYILAWRNRVDENTPIKSPSLKSMITRFTGIIDEAVTMPDNIIYFSAGDGWADIVTQLKVSGATMADPMHLLIDGYANGPGYAWIKEVVFISSNPSVHGEGDHGIIFLRNGGRVGLGNNSWNGSSIDSWKLLGKDYLTISPAGNGTVDLNSDIYVIDGGAFVAESNFGETEVNRLTINMNGNDLYVPAGGVLDLSSFGHNAYRQEIEFAGEGRVVLGHGATIRFPKGITPASAADAPVLYFNDSAKLVIEDDPEFGKVKYTTLSAADVDKVKIFGIGQIWLNKDSRFEVMGGAKVRVGSDIDTPYTWLRISIQRQGDFVIGDEQERGGSFEVGNVEAVAGVGENESTINFELTLNGEKARTHLDRGAFMGFGVGIIDKSSDNMNGNSTLALNPIVNSITGDVNFSPDTTDAWNIQTLYDVNQIKIYINKGVFDHSNIFNGLDRKASMLAVGPVYPYTHGTLDGSYTLELSDPDRSKILAGGNLMFLDGAGVSAYINAWNFADPVARETQQSPAEDYGMYNMLAADMIVQQQKVASFANSTVEKLSGGGIKIVTGTGGSKDFFDFISTPKYTELDTKMVNCGETEYRAYIGYINTPNTSNNYSYANANEIYRLTGLSVIGDGRPEDGTEIGILGTTGSNEPVMFTIVNRK